MQERLRLSLTLLALGNNVWVFKRGVSPSFQYLPLPLAKGKGIQGMGLQIIKPKGGTGSIDNL
jgi:hypothetical protein